MGFRLLKIPKHFHFSALTNVLLSMDYPCTTQM